MTLCTPEEAVEDIRQGRFVIIVDDEDRENEGDLAIAADRITPEASTSWRRTRAALSAWPVKGGDSTSSAFLPWSTRTPPSSAPRSRSASTPWDAG